MHFECKSFALAKDPAHPDEYEDAFDADPSGGTAAIADGVSSSLFSGKWARILTRGCLLERPPVETPAFAAWIARQREAWDAAIDPSHLAWHQKPKLSGGAFATLLWVEVDHATGTDSLSPPAGHLRYRAFAIGDCVLLHVRGDELLGTFPLSASAEFLRDPMAVGSKDLGRDAQFRFLATEQPLHAGDLLILGTDAIAAWAISLLENGESVDWSCWWTRSEEDWESLVLQLRAAGHMRYDDTTLGLLRIG